MRGGRKRLVLWLLLGVLIGFLIGFTGGWMYGTQYLRLPVKLGKTNWNLKLIRGRIIRLEHEHKKLTTIEGKLLEDFFKTLPLAVE